MAVTIPSLPAKPIALLFADLPRWGDAHAVLGDGVDARIGPDMVLVRRPSPWQLFAPSLLRDFLATTASDRGPTPWFLIILGSKDGKILAIREDGAVGLTPGEGAGGSRSKIKADQSVDRHGGRTVPIIGVTAPSPLSSRAPGPSGPPPSPAPPVQPAHGVLPSSRRRSTVPRLGATAAPRPSTRHVPLFRPLEANPETGLLPPRYQYALSGNFFKKSFPGKYPPGDGTRPQKLSNQFELGITQRSRLAEYP